MRPFRLARYAIAAVLFLGLSVNLVFFAPPVAKPSAVGFAPSLWAFVGASALLLVIAGVRQRRQRRNAHGPGRSRRSGHIRRRG